ncbi:MAG: hypothetical protein ACRDPG_04775 [Nocardioidaceae bacterium]
MARRVFLHVGTRSSGATQMQSIAWGSARSLREQGLLLPGTAALHGSAAREVTHANSVLGGETQSEAAWSRLAAAANRWPGDVLITHDLLSVANAEQATEVHQTLLPAELHLVLTATALDEVIPASWQELVKSGVPMLYSTFVEQIRLNQAKGARFWLMQDLLDVVRRWGAGIDASHVHIVTAPRRSPDPGPLWRRFASAVDAGADADLNDPELTSRRSVLGPVEVELLRRVHAAQDYRTHGSGHHRWTRRLLAGEVLARRPGPPISIPDAHLEWVSKRGAALASGVASAGFDLVGSADDLHPEKPPAGSRTPRSVTEGELAEAASWTIGELQEHWVELEAGTAPPTVGLDDGVPGILEMLEHIRAAGTGGLPRPAPSGEPVGSRYWLRSFKVLRGR